MLTPESPGPSHAHSGGQVVSLDDDAFDKLSPKTTIDHLLSEEERQKAEQERREFESVGMTMFLNEAKLYPTAYEFVCERVASGVSPDVIRGELPMIPETPNRLASIMREAYEDALAGRPPRFS